MRLSGPIPIVHPINIHLLGSSNNKQKSHSFFFGIYNLPLPRRAPLQYPCSSREYHPYQRRDGLLLGSASLPRTVLDLEITLTLNPKSLKSPIHINLYKPAPQNDLMSRRRSLPQFETVSASFPVSHVQTNPKSQFPPTILHNRAVPIPLTTQEGNLVGFNCSNSPL